MRKVFLALSLTLLPGIALAEKVPSVFYLTSRPAAQVGVIRNFDDGRVQVLHDRIRDTGVTAAVHPESGRYVLSVFTSVFENFDFVDPGRYFILGNVLKGAVGWTVPETNLNLRDHTESAPRFSHDGSRFFTTLRFRNNAFINSYDFSTGASERIFYNRWPRTFGRGIPVAELSMDEKNAVFAASRGRRIELSTWPVQSVTNEAPTPVLKLREFPFDIYPGKSLLVYKTFRYQRRNVKKTALSFYDLKISENYNIFTYSGLNPAGVDRDKDFVVDEKNKLLYTVDTPEGKVRTIYRINLHTLKVDPFYPNALRIFDISRDGRYLLYTRTRDESELAGPTGGWKEDPQIIAVLDLQTRETHLMAVPEALSYSYLAFLYN